MNLLLKDFSKNFLPSEIEHEVERTKQKFSLLKFNRLGTLLAVVFQDSTIAIWDFDTLNMIKYLENTKENRIKKIISIEWRLDGREIIFANSQKILFIWDILNSEFVAKLNIQQEITFIEKHPIDNNKYLITSSSETPSVLQLFPPQNYSSQKTKPEKDSLIDFKYKLFPLNKDLNNQPKKKIRKRKPTTIRGKIQIFQQAIFSPKGDRIYYVNNSKIEIWDSNSFEILNLFEIPKTEPLNLSISRNEDILLINGKEKKIHVIDLTTQSKIHEFFDFVEKRSWTKVLIHENGEYVVSGSSQDHLIYFWSIRNRELIKIVSDKSSDKGIHDIVFHPRFDIIVTCSENFVCTWAPMAQNNWRGFGSWFTELTEREQVKDVIPKPRNIENEEKDFLDIKTIQKDPLVQQYLNFENCLEEEIIDIPLDIGKEDEI
ncbi:retinoblastoma-binding protein [Anaeramoeba ignava]|uniref:Retinoblastoma-binding protein n=1 Tax=Anaeramoeba ignava TaxID=1746090 RepID=A0A9Q0LUD4_ANAIG|nr:retinoblastoma-binding protein [Anaeramoeba ignava]